MVCKELVVLVIIELCVETFADPAAPGILAELAAKDELVLVTSAPAEGLVAILRRVLPHHLVVALLVEAELTGYERALVHSLLEEGAVPVVVSDRHADAGLTNWHWLAADRRLTWTAGNPVSQTARALPGSTTGY